MTILRKKADRKNSGSSPKYLYQKKPRFFAQVADSVKDAAVLEIKYLGGADTSPSFRGIYFTARKDALYRIIYSSRLISRVLAPLVLFDCYNTDSLYKNARHVDWNDFFDENSTFAVFANVSDSKISGSKFAALRVKDGIVDYFLEHAGVRPKAASGDPDIDINLHISKNVAIISLDISGGAFHRRGYREASVSGYMRETMAAGIIRMTGWNGHGPLHDPMCGSGTLLCEALMHYCRIPAGIFRKHFGFEHLPDFEPVIWKQVREKENGKIREIPRNMISGSDISEAAIDATRTNLMGIHYGSRVEIRKADFKDLPELKNQVIVTSPPYDACAGKDIDMAEFYREFGKFLKQNCTDSTAYVYFGDPAGIKHTGLKPAWKKPFKAGGIDGRLVKYRLF